MQTKIAKIGAGLLLLSVCLMSFSTTAQNAPANATKAVSPQEKRANDQAEQYFQEALRFEVATRALPAMRRNWYEVVSKYRLAADLGHAGAMFRISNAYVVMNDEAQAATWLRRSAQAGSTSGQYFLAASIARNPNNCAEARTWLERAAAQGYAHAMGTLGQYYANGTCGPVDNTKAFVMHNNAAQRGFLPSQPVVAYFYINGTGIARSNVNALAWHNIYTKQPPLPEGQVQYLPARSMTFVSDLVGRLTETEKSQALELSRRICTQTFACLQIPAARRP
jgi:TPR repeat protein